MGEVINITHTEFQPLNNLSLNDEIEMREWLQDYFNLGGIRTPLETRAKDLFKKIL